VFIAAANLARQRCPLPLPGSPGSTRARTGTNWWQAPCKKRPQPAVERCPRVEAPVCNSSWSVRRVGAVSVTSTIEPTESLRSNQFFHTIRYGDEHGTQRHFPIQVLASPKHSLGAVLTKRSACGLFETPRSDMCQSEPGCANSVSGVARLRTRLTLPHQPTFTQVHSFRKPRPWCDVTRALVFAIRDNGARFTSSRWSDS